MPKLRKKARGFVKDYVLTENGTQAALKNYDTNDPHVAAVIASENLTKPEIQDAIVEEKKRFADRFSDDLIETKIKEGLDATAVRFTPEGERIDVPDYSTRHKFVNTAVEIKGHKAPDKHVNLNIDVDATTPVKDAADKLNALYRGGSVSGNGALPDPVGDQAQDQERSGPAD